MKRAAIIFLQCVIVLISILTLVILVRFPLYEGRNINATLAEVYFHDPFLAYFYMACIPVYVAFYQAFSLLGYIGQNKSLSPKALSALRSVKHCAITFAGLIVLPVAYLFIARPGDDIAGGVAMGLFLIVISSVIATAAARFERTLAAHSY